MPLSDIRDQTRLDFRLLSSCPIFDFPEKEPGLGLISRTAAGFRAYDSTSDSRHPTSDMSVGQYAYQGTCTSSNKIGVFIKICLNIV